MISIVMNKKIFIFVIALLYGGLIKAGNSGDDTISVKNKFDNERPGLGFDVGANLDFDDSSSDNYEYDQELAEVADFDGLVFNQPYDIDGFAPMAEDDSYSEDKHIHDDEEKKTKFDNKKLEEVLDIAANLDFDDCSLNHYEYDQNLVGAANLDGLAFNRPYTKDGFAPLAEDDLYSDDDYFNKSGSFTVDDK